MNSDIWVVGDIHGMLDPLKALIDTIRYIHCIKQNNRPTKIIFLGDYIDHGPSSKEVLDLLIDLPAEFETVFLCGNHEDLMLHFLENGEFSKKFGNVWFSRNGGQETILSFMKDPKIIRDIHQSEFMEYWHDIDYEEFTNDKLKLDPKYINFLYNLKMHHKETFTSNNRSIDLLFAHSTFYNKKYDPLQLLELDLEDQLKVNSRQEYQKLSKGDRDRLERLQLWSRFEPMEKYGDYLLFHGHTPTSLVSHYYNNIGNFNPKIALPFVKVPDNDSMNVVRTDTNRACFDVSIKDIISINVDTGAVYGKALTAAYLTPEDLLDDARIIFYQRRMDLPFRQNTNLINYCYEFNP